MNLAELVSRFTGIFRWWVSVAPWEQAVRVRLGKHVRVLGAGVHLRIPAVDRVFRQSTRRRFSSVPTQTVTTRDEKTVTISGALGYAIADVGALYNTVHQAEDTIQTEAQAAVARYVHAHDLAECSPITLEHVVTEALDLGRYGISGVEFSVTDFAVVKTFRLIQGEPKSYSHEGAYLSTALEDGATPR